MTQQPAVPHDPPAPTAPTDAVRAEPRGVTANYKTINVRPWKQSTAVLAIMTQALFAVAGGADLYLAWLDLKVKGLLDGRDFEAMEREARAAEGLNPIIIGAGLLAGVLMLVWLHRVWTSDRSDHSLYTRGTGLAIGGWFIPIANIGLGPLALRDLLWGTEHASPRARPGRPPATPPLVMAFWLVLGLNIILAGLERGAQRGVARPESLAALVTSFRSSLTYEALGGLTGAAGALVAILIIRQVMVYTRR